MSSSVPLKYQTLSSSIHISFWQELSKRKLEVLRLSTAPVNITGRIQIASDARLPSTIEISSESFSTISNDKNQGTQVTTKITPSHEYCVPGKLHIVNTLEDYKNCDKRQMLDQAANNIWKNLQSQQLADQQRPTNACEFFILVHADLKKHKFLYWFCFPGIQLKDVSPVLLRTIPSSMEVPPVAPIAPVTDALNAALSEYEKVQGNDVQLLRPCCALVSSNNLDTVTVMPLADYVQQLCDGGNSSNNNNNNNNGDNRGTTFSSFSLVFYDPCSLATSPGWTLRNILTSLVVNTAIPRDFVVHCLRLKDGGKRRPYVVQTLPVSLPAAPVSGSTGNSIGDSVTITGLGASWETDRKNRPRPRLADLSSSMDPRNLARVSVDLNVKLMRWRMLPELQTELLQQTKCLLLGAGTLGCNVGRCLMGWGVRHITFVDNGRVSYSNPVRQSLFRFEDCANGGIPKAAAAAAELQRIFPDVQSRGIQMNIHMPGHTVSSEAAAAVEIETAALEELIKEHDVIYLLTDTRESRWLPTMLGAKHDKMVINCALGFDSFLVMRHGATEAENNDEEGKEMDGKETDGKETKEKVVAADGVGVVSGGRLGCYFCQDIVAPGDSTRDRTLDQQCTVTRPGLALMAGALSVELMVGLLHHPLKHHAPADESKPVFQACDRRLGLLPHQIRGYLTHYQNIVTHGPAFKQCTACSPIVRQEYEKNKFGFLHRVFNDSGKYLEELSGIAELTRGADQYDLDDFAMSDDDDF